MEKRIENILSQLTAEEKITLCAGASVLKTAAIERLGIHEMEMADGPQGVRAATPENTPPTALPCGTALAATFDPLLAEKYGQAVAMDCKALGIGVSLGPGLNLLRTPLNGRNFEYYGEDPVLSGKIAAGYIRGCQSEKVAATPKHLALNNQEICRTTGSSDIDERTLRELYLTAFEIAVKEGKPWMLMSSYNRINGTFAAENGFTQDLIAKREWGFDGVMVCDWGAAHDTAGCALGGLDLEMPGPGVFFTVEKLLPMVKNGMIQESLIDDKVRRILRLLCRTGAIDGLKPDGTCGGPVQAATARKCAENSTVLLKNQNRLLPLDAGKIRKIVISGPNADFRHHRGTLRDQGGSGAVFTEKEITPLAGLQNFARKHGIEVKYIPTIRFDHALPCPDGFFGTDGIKCVYYPDQQAMKDERDILFENVNHTGSWNFTTASNQIADSTDGEKNLLPQNGFAVRMTATLHPPAGHRNLKLIFTPNSDTCRIKLNGKLIWENIHEELIHIHELAGNETDNIRLEIEFATRFPNFSSFKIALEDPDSLADAANTLLAEAKSADAVIFCAGRTHMEDKEALGWGNFYTADIPALTMPDNQDKLISDLAAVNPNTIVTLTGGGVMDVEKWIDAVPALLMLWYPGEAGGEVLSDILFGKVNPSGHLPVSWAKNLNDYPCHANGNYPGNREDADPRVRYDEGIFVGYRHFDREKTDLRYPFGFGLSYSDFKIELTDVTQTGMTTLDAALQATAKVTNISDRKGSEVIQLYAGAESPEFPRPVKELKAFAKVELAPGESREIKFELKWRDFACFHPELHHWCLPQGQYRIYLARNAADIIAVKTITLSDKINR